MGLGTLGALSGATRCRPVTGTLAHSPPTSSALLTATEGRLSWQSLGALAVSRRGGWTISAKRMPLVRGTPCLELLLPAALLLVRLAQMAELTGQTICTSLCLVEERTWLATSGCMTSRADAWHFFRAWGCMVRWSGHSLEPPSCRRRGSPQSHQAGNTTGNTFRIGRTCFTELAAGRQHHSSPRVTAANSIWLWYSSHMRKAICEGTRTGKLLAACTCLRHLRRCHDCIIQ
mmetsp:Transcript_8347/g.23453  ORF Transcript_8347/g.23453 Transcript_8347/m.23453 type:complete len:232 (+) Transcript_8347:40-735(+)